MLVWVSFAWLTHRPTCSLETTTQSPCLFLFQHERLPTKLGLTQAKAQLSTWKGSCSANQELVEAEWRLITSGI